jgi:hypothetical protein
VKVLATVKLRAILSIVFVGILCTGLTSCSSKNATTNVTTTPVAPIEKAPFEKFSFRISGSGITSQGKPYDSWIMDTNHMMGVHTQKRGSNGKFRNINGLAELDAPDYDSLRQLILKGKLYTIDSSDLTQVCADDELYQLDIVPLAAIKPVRLAFGTCSKDYNLLLEPQRAYFAKLLDWFEQKRVKYRPDQPE